MTNHQYLLGFDVGSSSVKASLVDADSGRVAASAFFPESEAPILAAKPGWAEQDPESWWRYASQALRKVMADAGASGEDIKAIGISYQMHGLVCVDRDLKPLRPAIIWCDSRAVPYGERAFRDLGAEKCLGHLLEIDNKGDYDRYFRTETFGKKIKFKEPDFGDRNNPDNSTSAKEQMQYMTDYVNEVEKLLNARNFDPENGYRSMMEVGTFIGNYIVHELMKNVDGGMRLSTYFAKDSDTKLFMPFVWDFDLTLGNYNGDPSARNSFYLSDANTPQGWLIRLRGGSFETVNGVSDPYGAKTSYYQCLFEDPLFVEDLKEYWNRVYPRLQKIPDFIDKMVEYNSLAYDHNVSAGKNPRANNRGSGIRRYSSWSAAVTDLKDWYSQRLTWLNTNINSLVAQHYNESTRKYENL